MQAVLEFLQGFENIGMEIELTGKRQGISLAESNAIWVGHKDFEISKLADTNGTFFAPRRQRDKPVEGNRFRIDFQFLSNLQNGLVQRVGVNIIPDKINIDGQARTAQQGQRATTDQDQPGTRRDTRSHVLQDRANLRNVQQLPLSILLPYLPHFFCVLVGGQPVNVRAAAFPVTVRQRMQVFIGIISRVKV